LVIKGLVWDDEEDPDGNVQHLARHHVQQWEVREVLEGGPVFRRTLEDGANPTFVVVGYTAAGRLLEVWGIYFEQPPKTGWWRTITAMDARPAQRELWGNERGGLR
jgi:hypothetical protein